MLEVFLSQVCPEALHAAWKYLPFENIRNPADSTTRTAQQTFAAIDATGKVLVSAADTTAGYLNPSLSISNGLVASILNPGENEVLSIAGVDATTAAKGVASFSSTNFDVVAGAVSLKVGGVSATNLNTGTGAGQIYSATIPTDTTNFNNNLSAADTTVQKALDTLDNISVSGLLNVYLTVGDYTLLDPRQVVLVDCTFGNRVVTLNAVATYGNGRRVFVKKLDATANTVTIQSGAAENIDGAASVILVNQWEGTEIVGLTNQWYILSNKN